MEISRVFRNEGGRAPYNEEYTIVGSRNLWNPRNPTVRARLREIGGVVWNFLVYDHPCAVGNGAGGVKQVHLKGAIFANILSRQLTAGA